MVVCVCVRICMWKIAWSSDQRKFLCSYEFNWTTYWNMLNFFVDMHFTKTDYRCIHVGHELLLQLMMCNTHIIFIHGTCLATIFSYYFFFLEQIESKSNIFYATDKEKHKFVLRKKFHRKLAWGFMKILETIFIIGPPPQCIFSTIFFW